ncbi:hypothetical protein KIN20_000499 [Parelaphostrongylus tenuis]|uniref:C2H2-type domain-containing protein n=1 Tax=Parelaphostrongylus tenuis TaxID=148309 RepID=A0AAD5LW79_PARTN|nr:hypothetical protein KIN20_000499 [Parelaphostrongylus tenuis]
MEVGYVDIKAVKSCDAKLMSAGLITVTMPSISIVCSCCYCSSLETPEQLCDHVSTVHGNPAPINEQTFDDESQLQAWLSEVEDCRTEGGYVGSEEGPSDQEKEYYLLCRVRLSPMLKRRRLLESPRFPEPDCSTVSCTAFIHVMERIDGSVYVRFCLEHAGHLPSDPLRISPPLSKMRRKRSNMKNTSLRLKNMVSDNITDSSVNAQQAVSRDVEMKCGEMTEDSNNLSLRRKGEMAPDIEFDISSLNSQITQRLDSTTDRLRVLTQVLADLAVDIHAFKERQCGIVN